MNPEQVVALLLIMADNRLVMDAQARRIAELEGLLAAATDAKADHA
jgi:hypothetical protein